MSATPRDPTQTAPRPPGPLGMAEAAPLLRLADLTTPMAVRVAATLRLADHVAAGRCDLEGLAEASGAHAGALRRLLAHLVARGVFAEPRTGTYGLTELSRLLLDDRPDSRRLRLAVDGATGRADLAALRLLDSVLTGEPAYQLMYGRTFWQDLEADPGLNDSFDAVMASHVAGTGLDRAYDWTGVRRVVDVGGGTGTLIAELLRAHQHLEATLVDLPGVVDAARAQLAEAGVADRVTLAAGSFFDALPAGGSVYVLCKILHDWDDAEAVTILARCAEAAGPRGRVLVIELVAGDGEDLRMFTEMDLRMLVALGGRERTLDEFRALAAGAGLRVRVAGSVVAGAVLELTPIPPPGPRTPNPNEQNEQEE